MRHSRHERHRRYKRYERHDPAVVPPDPITFTTQLPPDMAVAVDAVLTLSVAVTGGVSPYTYVWKKGATAIPGATAASYSISKAATTDSGSYTCEVTDAATTKAVSSACVVTVS